MENFCPRCIKRGICIFEDKLTKLEATKGNPLGMTVDTCTKFLLDETVEDEEPEDIED